MCTAGAVGCAPVTQRSPSSWGANTSSAAPPRRALRSCWPSAAEAIDLRPQPRSGPTLCALYRPLVAGATRAAAIAAAAVLDTKLRCPLMVLPMLNRTKTGLGSVLHATRVTASCRRHRGTCKRLQSRLSNLPCFPQAGDSSSDCTPLLEGQQPPLYQDKGTAFVLTATAGC